jgi:hypothetical protein
MVAKTNADLTPAVIKQHLKIIQEKYSGLCVFVQEGISAYNRARLIQHHVPFIIPGNQTYLPDLGIDLREHFLKLRSHKAFSPATQAVIIDALVHGIQDKFTPSSFNLGYTLMTMSRAFDELQTAGIGAITHKGRERWWIYSGNKRQLWEQTEPLMKSPVKERCYLVQDPPPIIENVQAGLTALARCSMLQAPKLNVFAIGQDKLDTLEERGLEPVNVVDEANCEVEVWYYDPSLFAKDKMADPFSLYLSLIQEADERTELALEEMMEQIKW